MARVKPSLVEYSGTIGDFVTHINFTGRHDDSSWLAGNARGMQLNCIFASSKKTS